MPEEHSKAPSDLGPAGRRLWSWLSQNFDTAGCEPLVVEICRLQDRLASIRQAIAKDPNDLKLVSLEMGATAAFARCWKMLGLADVDAKGRPGYPAGVPRRRA